MSEITVLGWINYAIGLAFGIAIGYINWGRT